MKKNNNSRYTYECSDGVCRLVENPGQGQLMPSVADSAFPLPKEGKWTIYGTEYCGFCRRARNLLEAKDVQYSYRSVTLADRNEHLADLTENYPYVPMIFKGLQFIGGFSDLCQYFTASQED